MGFSFLFQGFGIWHLAFERAFLGGGGGGGAWEIAVLCCVLVGDGILGCRINYFNSPSIEKDNEMVLRLLDCID